MNRYFNLKQLHYLVTLYEYQHFGRAAKACFISQSTLSASITSLEESLETKLLERNHKSFLFTPIGEEVVRRSRIIIDQCTELVDFAKNQGKSMHGTLYLGIIPTIAPFILNELQNLCQQLYPELTLYIKEDTTDNVLKELREGKLDLVILAFPYPIEDVQTRILGKDYFKIVFPKNLLHQGFDQEISNFPENSIFLLQKEHCLTGHALQACQLKHSKQINHFFATSLHTLIQMVSHQPGITFLPELAINSGILLGTDLVSLPLKNDRAYRELGIAWRGTSHKIKDYMLLADLIQQIIKEKSLDREQKNSCT